MFDGWYLVNYSDIYLMYVHVAMSVLLIPNAKGSKDHVSDKRFG